MLGSQALFSGVQWQDKHQWAHTEIQEIQLKHKKLFFTVEAI